MMYHFATYERATGRVLSAGKSTNELIIELTRDRLADGEELYVGEIDPKTTFLPAGFPAPLPEVQIVIEAKDVKEHAGRILSYTDWVDIRAISGLPASPEMIAYRQAVRDASNVIEAMQPIPADFRDPKYWPEQP